jgi:hypothetical protein
MTLVEELRQDPTGMGYAVYLPDAPGIVADLLNVQLTTMAQERWVTALTILSECPSGPSIIRKLYAASQQDAVVLVAWNRLNSSTGLNVNDGATKANINGLVALQVLDQSEGDELKALAIQPASRAQVLGLAPVTVLDVMNNWN